MLHLFDYVGPVWSSISNNNFHISNILTHILTHFFTYMYFKKFQKTQNNNSQTHLPNRPILFTQVFFFFFNVMFHMRRIQFRNTPGRHLPPFFFSEFACLSPN